MINAFERTNDKDVLDLIWNNTTDAIFTISHDGSILNVNPAFENMLGWNIENLEGIAYPPFMINMTTEEQQELLRQLKAGQDFPYSVIKRMHKYGGILDILASYRAINNEEILAIGMYKDFTEQMFIQEKLQESERNYRTLVENLPEAIIKQQNGVIDFINSSGVELFGQNQLQEIIGKSIWDFVSSDRKDEIQELIEAAYENEQWTKPKTVVGKLLRKDGNGIWSEVKVIPIGSKEKPDIQIVIRDITKEKMYESKLEFLAYHDPLTGLTNRRKFTKIVTDSIKEVKETKGELAMMYIDVDNFKTVNDTFGHDIGDKLLQQFSYRLQSSVRENDVLSRVGGDEFLVLLRDIQDKKQISSIAKRMHQAFQEPYEINDTSLHVTASIGISILSKDGLDAKSLIFNADKALYKAKVQKNNYSF